MSLVAGEISAFLLAFFFTRKEYHFSFPTKKISKETRQVLKLMPAACLNAVINQINHIVDKAFGSILTAGSLTYLTYGNKIVSLFDGVVTTAFSTAFFPHLAELNAKEDEDGLKSFLSQYLLVLLGFLIPVMFIMTTYSSAIVKIVLGHGQFDEYSVQQTSLVLFIYSFGLLAMGINTLFNDVFYIKKKTSILMITNVINIFINLGLDMLLVKRFGIGGLCLATTISLYLTMLVKVAFVRKFFLFNKKLIKQILLIVLACIVGMIIPMTFRVIGLLGSYVEFVIGSVCFILIYGLILFHPRTEFNKLVQEYFLKRKR